MDSTIITIIVGSIILLACAIAWEYNKLIKLKEETKELHTELQTLKAIHNHKKSDTSAKISLAETTNKYNEKAKKFNLHIRLFPVNLLAKAAKHTPFEIEEAPLTQDSQK